MQCIKIFKKYDLLMIYNKWVYIWNFYFTNSHALSKEKKEKKEEDQ